jgi:hypothetical protein
MRHIRIIVYNGEDKWLRHTLDRSLKPGAACMGSNNYITIYEPNEKALELANQAIAEAEAIYG